MLNVQIVLFDGFDLLDAIAPYEVFCAAGMFVDGTLCVEFVTAEGPRFVPSGVNGLKIEASGRLSSDRKGIILVPGASGEVEGDGPNAIPAILARAMNTELTDILEQALGHSGYSSCYRMRGFPAARHGRTAGRPAGRNESLRVSRR